MKWLQRFGLLVFLVACSSPQPVRRDVRFAAPPGFVALDTVSTGAKSYVDFATHEKLEIGYARHAPPRHVPPGQQLSSFVMCKNVSATVWQYKRGNEMWMHFAEPLGGGRYFEAIYVRPEHAKISRGVMYALTTACPQ